jgi:hypothetical protein
VRRPGVSADSTSDEDGAARRRQRRDTLLQARREETARDGARTMEGAELWRAFDFGADAKSPIGCAPVGRKYAAGKGGILGERGCLVEKFRVFVLSGVIPSRCITLKKNSFQMPLRAVPCTISRVVSKNNKLLTMHSFIISF